MKRSEAVGAAVGGEVGEAVRSAARYAAIVVLEMLPAWLARTRPQRGESLARVQAILERYPDVSLRWFDADALGHGYTDFAVCEFDDLERYQFLWDEIRDTELFTVPLARVRRVMLGCEEAFRRFEAQASA